MTVPTTGNIFGDLDIANAEDNPFAIPDNTYEAYVTNTKVGETKKGDKLGLTIEYTIDGGDHNSKKVSEFKHVPRKEDDMEPADRERAKSFLKQRLTSLGVPDTKMNDLDPADLVGIPVKIEVLTKEGYTNIRSVEVRKVGGSIFNK